MATIWVGSVAQGAGNGTSAANRYGLASLNTAVTAAGAGGTVNLVVEDPFTLVGNGPVATITAGGSSGSPVTVRGVHADGSPSTDTYDITSNRSNPYVPPAPSNDDVWAPVGSTGTTGEVIFNLETGHNWVNWENVRALRTDRLFRIRDVLTMVQFDRIKGRNIRQLIKVESSTGPRPTGLRGVSSAQRCRITNVDVRGHSKQLIVLNASAHVHVEDVYTDSQGQDNDGIAAGVVTQGSDALNANDDIVIRKVTGKNLINLVAASTPYRASLAKTGTVSGGNYKVRYNGNDTADIAWNATNAQIRTAVGALPGLTASDVFVSGTAMSSGGPVTIGLGFNLLAAGPASVLTVQPGTSPLTGGGSYAITTAQAWAAMQPGYHQGDVISTEEFDTDIDLDLIHGDQVGDAVIDGKASASRIRRFSGIGAKHTIRTHPSAGADQDTGTVAQSCRSFDVINRVYPVGHPLAGQQGTGNASHFETNGKLHVLDPYIREIDPDAYCFECVDSTSELAVYGGDIERPSGSSIEFSPPGSVVLFCGDMTDILT